MALINFCSHVSLYQFIYYGLNQLSCSTVLIFKFSEFSEACATVWHKSRCPGCDFFLFIRVHPGIPVNFSVLFQIYMCHVR